MAIVKWLPQSTFCCFARSPQHLSSTCIFPLYGIPCALPFSPLPSLYQPAVKAAQKRPRECRNKMLGVEQ